MANGGVVTGGPKGGNAYIPPFEVIAADHHSYLPQYSRTYRGEARIQELIPSSLANERDYGSLKEEQGLGKIINYANKTRSVHGVGVGVNQFLNSYKTVANDGEYPYANSTDSTKKESVYFSSRRI